MRPAFHSVGFSAKKVRTSSKNCRNFAQISKSEKNGDTGAEYGGRGGIPPSDPPSAPPAPFLILSGILDTNANGSRGEKTRERERTNGFSPL
jgi:hypothetical protein